MYKIDHKNLRAKIKNLFLKTMICFSGCLMSSASLQKLFCEVCSALKCSFEEFVREKVFFPSYSSAIFPQSSKSTLKGSWLGFVVVQLLSHVWVCDPMNCSTPGLPVLHDLLELAQTHVHWVSDAIQPSHPMSSPSPLALNLSQHQGFFQWVGSLHQVAKVLELHLQPQSFQWWAHFILWAAQKGIFSTPLKAISWGSNQMCPTLYLQGCLA